MFTVNKQLGVSTESCMQAARNRDPTDIALDERKRQEAKITKQKKQALQLQAKRKAQEKGGVGSGPSGKTEVVFRAYHQGGIKDQTKKDVNLDEDAEEGVVVDDADEGDADMTMDDPMQVSCPPCLTGMCVWVKACAHWLAGFLRFVNFCGLQQGFDSLPV